MPCPDCAGVSTGTFTVPLGASDKAGGRPSAPGVSTFLGVPSFTGCWAGNGVPSILRKGGERGCGKGPWPCVTEVWGPCACAGNGILGNVIGGGAWAFSVEGKGGVGTCPLPLAAAVSVPEGETGACGDSSCPCWLCASDCAAGVLVSTTLRFPFASMIVVWWAPPAVFTSIWLFCLALMGASGPAAHKGPKARTRLATVKRTGTLSNTFFPMKARGAATRTQEALRTERPLQRLHREKRV